MPVIKLTLKRPTPAGGSSQTTFQLPPAAAAAADAGRPAPPKASPSAAAAAAAAADASKSRPSRTRKRESVGDDDLGDIQLPKGALIRLIKQKLNTIAGKETGDVHPDVYSAISHSALAFISYLGTTASALNENTKSRALSGDDVIAAIEELGLSVSLRPPNRPDTDVFSVWALPVHGLRFACRSLLLSLARPVAKQDLQASNWSEPFGGELAKLLAGHKNEAAMTAASRKKKARQTAEEELSPRESPIGQDDIMLSSGGMSPSEVQGGQHDGMAAEPADDGGGAAADESFGSGQMASEEENSFAADSD